MHTAVLRNTPRGTQLCAVVVYNAYTPESEYQVAYRGVCLGGKNEKIL